MKMGEFYKRLDVALNVCSVCFQETDSATNEEEDELMIEVPGSAYSIDQKINHDAP